MRQDEAVALSWFWHFFFLQKNATQNAYKSISEPLDFKIFWGEVGLPPDPPSGSRLWRSKLALPYSEVWLRPWVRSNKIWNRVMLSGEGNENGEKTTMGLISKKVTSQVQHTFFVHFFAVVLDDCNVKLPETFWLLVLWRKCRTCSCYPFFSLPLTFT